MIRKREKTPFHMKKRLTRLFFVLGGLSLFIACGNDGYLNQPLEVSQSLKTRLSLKPTQPLVDPVSERFRPDGFVIYSLEGAKITADAKAGIISARIAVKSSAGRELVELEGKIRKNGTATLVDLNPISPTKHRLVAEAYCADASECRHVILNVYYKVENKTKRQQFVTEALLAANTRDRERPHESKDHDELDHGDADPENPNDELVGREQMGEFVGAPRNEEAIKQLWERPEIPLPIPSSNDLETETEQETEDKSESDVTPETPRSAPAEKSKVGGDTPPMPQESGAQQEEPPSDHTSDKSRGNTPPETAPPAEAPEPKPKVDPVPSEPSETRTETPQPQRKPPQERATDAPTNKADEDMPNLNRVFSDQLDKIESVIAPLLSLRDGGLSVGWHNNGRLQKASPLPEAGNGFKKVNFTRDTHWGSGMMVTLLQNIGAYIKTNWYPDLTVVVGDISKRSGGPVGSHASHQTGLDADIAYIGNSGFASVLDNQGRISSKLDYSKTWQFLRVVASQRFIEDGEEVSILGRVFVNPKIKQGFCDWAKKHKVLENAWDADIMRRIRPASGHYQHFHLRLRCSPHYPDCRKQVEPPAGTGC